jgi:hypothetical protein
MLIENDRSYSVRRYTCRVGRVTPERAVFWRAEDCPPYLLCSLKLVGRLCQTPRRFTETPYNFISALRGYAIRERVGVKVGVVTQTVPRTIFFGCLADAAFLTFGIIIPRIVPSDGEKGPVGAFQVLH